MIYSIFMNDAEFSILKKEIGERISNERSIRKISQNELARDIHYSKAQIGKVERGECMVTVEMAVVLSAYFEVSLDYLLSAYFGISLDYLILGKEDQDPEGVLRAVYDRLDETFSDIIFYLACHLLGHRNAHRRRR